MSVLSPSGYKLEARLEKHKPEFHFSYFFKATENKNLTILVYQHVFLFLNNMQMSSILMAGLK